MSIKIAIISSHPIQYNAPLFALLARETSFELKVFYTWGESSLGARFDPDFGKIIDWDIPLLEGYNYHFTRNTSKKPGSNSFRGIKNPDLIKEIETWGADIVWVWGWAFHSHLKVMRHFHGKKTVWFRGDSTLLDEPKAFSIKKILRRIFLTWVYKQVDKAFFVGTHNKLYFEAHGLKQNQLIYAPHAIDNNRFLDSSGEKEKKAQKWSSNLGFSKDDIILLFAGKLEVKKNPFFLINLSNKLLGDKYKFLIVGNGKLEKNLKIASKKDNRFVFLNFQNQSQMPILYRLADFFILPSIGPGETWGLAINEALSSGIKVLGSIKCGGAIDLINDKNGLIFNPINGINEVLEYLKNEKSIIGNNSLLQGHNYDDIVKAVVMEVNQMKFIK